MEQRRMRRTVACLVAALAASLVWQVVGVPVSQGDDDLIRAYLPVAVSNYSVTPTPVGGGRGQILFSAWEAGNDEVFIVDLDGSNERNLSNSPWNDTEPAWSPDGMKIAFTSERDANHEIYIMDADGANQINLTKTSPDRESSPSWSPDGSRIAFSGSGVGTGPNIYTMKADGTGRVRLTYKTGVVMPDCNMEPVWSPDGRRIAFTSQRRQGDGVDIYVMNSDGSGQTGLTPDPWVNMHPSWSPDGRQIAFVSNRDGTRNEIYVMDANGSNQTRLTHTPTIDEKWPSWSPDGTKIAFVASNRIWIMDADGSNPEMLPIRSVRDYRPGWRP